jgi:hypothetical protein
MRAIEGREPAGVHLAVFVEPFLTAVLEGRKTMESRFTLTRQPPWRCVEPGDIILLKRSGGAIVGLVRAGEAQSHELSPSLVRLLRERFGVQLCATDDDFWSRRADKNYATLIEISDVELLSDVAIEKRDRRGWVSYGRGSEGRLALAD